MSHGEGAIHCELVNHVALITLDRPRALNALSHAMVRQLHAWLDGIEADPNIHAVVLRGAGPKAFCAGGDVIALAESVRQDGALHRAFFVDEYRLDFRIHTFAKPVVAVLHGVVMGGGMGLAQGAALRLVTQDVRMAMPETRIGLVPDVGASHFFSKMPASLAAYLALSGVTLGPADALFAGLADARSRVDDPQGLPALLQAMAWSAKDRAAPLAALRRALAATPAASDMDGGALAGQQELVRRHFDPALSLPAILAGLEARGDAWSQATARALRNHSPLMLALTLASLEHGRHHDLAACLTMEYGLVQYALGCGEFGEGVRAHLIDKDKSPAWCVPTVEALTPVQVGAALAAARALSSGFSL